MSNQFLVAKFVNSFPHILERRFPGDRFAEFAAETAQAVASSFEQTGLKSSASRWCLASALDELDCLVRNSDGALQDYLEVLSAVYVAIWRWQNLPD